MESRFSLSLSSPLRPRERARHFPMTTDVVALDTAVAPLVAEVVRRRNNIAVAHVCACVSLDAPASALASSSAEGRRGDPPALPPVTGGVALRRRTAN